MPTATGSIVLTRVGSFTLNWLGAATESVVLAMPPALPIARAPPEELLCSVSCTPPHSVAIAFASSSLLTDRFLIIMVVAPKNLSWVTDGEHFSRSRGLMHRVCQRVRRGEEKSQLPETTAMI